MYKSIVSGLCVFILLLGCSGENKEDQSIRDLYAQYNQGVREGAVDEVLGILDKQTFAFYEELATKTRELDSLQLSKESIYIITTVLSIRHLASKEEIIAFDGPGLLRYSFENGPLGQDRREQDGLGEIEHEGDHARAELIVRGKSTPFKYDFYKEDGTWKINLVNDREQINLELNKVLEEKGITMHEYLEVVLKVQNGIPPSKDIWKPVLPDRE